MATVSSLFGLSPEQILSAQFQRQQQENALRQQQLMQGGQEFGMYAPLYRAGLQLSDVGSRAAMQGLFGPQQDPQLAKAVDVRRIIGGRNVFDPAELQNVVNDLSAAGYAEEAMAVEAEGRKRGIETRKLEIMEQEAGIKRVGAVRAAQEQEQKDIKFYTDNPDQATFELQRLAQVIEADPTNQAAINRYQKIAAAGSTGAQERFAKEEKESLGTEKDRALLAKYEKELEDANKFGPAERWNAETQAARDLLRGYNIDPSKPIKGQVPATVLRGPGGQTLIRAQQTALQRKTSEGGGPTTAAQPAAARVIDFGQLPK